MSFFDALVRAYDSFLTFFPVDLHWVVTLAIILVMVGLFIALIRQNILFVFVAIPVFVLLWPVFAEFMTDMGAFFVYLLHTGATPK